MLLPLIRFFSPLTPLKSSETVGIVNIYVPTALFSFLESWISVPLDLDRLRDSGLLAFFHGCLQQMFTLKLVLRFRDVAITVRNEKMVLC